MISLAALAGCLGIAGLIYATVILLRLSRKLGEVTKLPPYYLGYHIATALLTVALVTKLISATSLFPSGATWSYLLFHNAALALGLTLSAVVTWKYWSWLLLEK